MQEVRLANNRNVYSPGYRTKKSHTNETDLVGMCDAK